MTKCVYSIVPPKSGSLKPNDSIIVRYASLPPLHPRTGKVPRGLKYGVPAWITTKHASSYWRLDTLNFRPFQVCSLAEWHAMQQDPLWVWKVMYALPALCSTASNPVATCMIQHWRDSALFAQKLSYMRKRLPMMLTVFPIVKSFGETLSTVDRRLTFALCGLWIVDCALSIVHCRLCIVDCRSQMTFVLCTLEIIWPFRATVLLSKKKCCSFVRKLSWKSHANLN